MTLQTSLSIAMSEINAEFGLGTDMGSYKNVVWYKDDGATGTFAASGIAFSDFYSKRKTAPLVSVTAPNHIQNLNIFNAAVAAGWNQSSAVTYTIPANTYIWSDSTSLPALDTGGLFPGGLTIINNGYIMGKGGAGAPVTGGYSCGAAGAGGAAIVVTDNCTITNNSYIGGGGGGGGGGGAHVYNSNMRIYYDYYAPGGGGAGGGNGGWIAASGFYMGGTITPPFYGKSPEFCYGGAIGQIGGRAGYYAIGGGYGPYPYRLGGGGGRIMPGTGGAGGTAGTTANGNGAGGGAGGGGAANQASGTAAPFNRGGNGGSGGAVGETPGATQTALGGGGGGWGASGGSGKGGGGGTSTGGAGGGPAYNIKSGKTLTTNGTGTTYGATTYY